MSEEVDAPDTLKLAYWIMLALYHAWFRFLPSHSRMGRLLPAIYEGGWPSTHTCMKHAPPPAHAPPIFVNWGLETAECQQTETVSPYISVTDQITSPVPHFLITRHLKIPGKSRIAPLTFDCLRRTDLKVSHHWRFLSLWWHLANEGNKRQSQKYAEDNL